MNSSGRANGTGAGASAIAAGRSLIAAASACETPLSDCGAAASDFEAAASGVWGGADSLDDPQAPVKRQIKIRGANRIVILRREVLSRNRVTPTYTGPRVIRIS